jgi:hypothetical protein
MLNALLSPTLLFHLSFALPTLWFRTVIPLSARIFILTLLAMIAFASNSLL